MGLAQFLPAALSESFFQHIVGKIWITFALCIVFLGLLKIEQVHILGGTLTKTNFIFRRKIKLDSIKRYKVKANDMNTYPQYNIAAILKIVKNGERYSKFRFLTIYTEGKWRIKIDERTMPTADFEKVLREVKKAKR